MCPSSPLATSSQTSRPSFHKRQKPEVSALTLVLAISVSPHPCLLPRACPRAVGHPRTRKGATALAKWAQAGVLGAPDSKNAVKQLCAVGQLSSSLASVSSPIGQGLGPLRIPWPWGLGSGWQRMTGVPGHTLQGFPLPLACPQRKREGKGRNETAGLRFALP